MGHPLLMELLLKVGNYRNKPLLVECDIYGVFSENKPQSVACVTCTWNIGPWNKKQNDQEQEKMGRG